MDKILQKSLSGLSELQRIIYSDSVTKGFHSAEEKPNIGNYVANLHGEVSELWEAYRINQLNQPCDKAEEMQNNLGETLTCAEEELADIVIRALDTSYVLNINMEKAIRVKMEFNRTRPHRHGGKIA